MYKKILSLVLLLAVLVSMAVMNVSAANSTYLSEATSSAVEADQPTTVNSTDASTDDEPATPDSKESVSTGQERTIVYISVAMMCVSAGIIFFARKNRIAQIVSI